MHEVYEVCKRLKEAGFPQEGRYRRVYETVSDSAWGDMADMARASDNPLACPNASECMKFAREKWPDSCMGVIVMRYSGPRYRSEIWDFLPGNPFGGMSSRIVSGEHPTDPDQAARLALAAALEADHVAK